jgi:predicted NAD/FAD-binding protein
LPQRGQEHDSPALIDPDSVVIVRSVMPHPVFPVASFVVERWKTELADIRTPLMRH